MQKLICTSKAVNKVLMSKDGRERKRVVHLRIGALSLLAAGCVIFSGICLRGIGLAQREPSLFSAPCPSFLPEVASASNRRGAAVSREMSVSHKSYLQKYVLQSICVAGKPKKSLSLSPKIFSK